MDPGAARWKAADVAAWLKSIGATRYLDRFHRAQVDGAALLRLGDDDLVAIGVLDAIPRSRILKEIGALRAGADLGVQRARFERAVQDLPAAASSSSGRSSSPSPLPPPGPLPPIARGQREPDRSPPRRSLRSAGSMAGVVVVPGPSPPSPSATIDDADAIAPSSRRMSAVLEAADEGTDVDDDRPTSASASASGVESNGESDDPAMAAAAATAIDVADRDNLRMSIPMATAAMKFAKNLSKKQRLSHRRTTSSASRRGSSQSSSAGAGLAATPFVATPPPSSPQRLTMDALLATTMPRNVPKVATMDETTGSYDVSSSSIGKYIADLTVAVDQLKSIRAEAEARDRAIELEIEKQKAEQMKGAGTMFSAVLAKAKKSGAGGRRNSRWYEVMGNKEPTSAADVAQQVRTDMVFKRMRRNSRIIMSPEDQRANAMADGANAAGSDQESDEDVEDEPEEVEKRFWIILPTNSIRLKWDLIIMFLVLYYGFMTPIDMAFGDQVNQPVLDNVFNAMFAFDMFLNFFTAYRIEEGPDRGQLEVSFVKIGKEYLKKWFWIDAVATIPLEMIMSSMGISLNASFNKLARLMRGFKLIRVLRMSRIFKRLSQANQNNPAMLRLGKYFGMLLVMWHWMGCFYWYIAQGEGFGSSSWVPDERYENAPFGSRYTQAFFWAVMVTTGVGRDVVPSSSTSTVFTIISIVTGVLMYAFIVGSASTALGNMDAAEAEKRAKLETIFQFLKQRDVDPKLQSRIIEYYDYLWSRQINSEALMSDLHTALKLKLDLVLNSKLIQKVPMFQDMSQNCLLAVIKKLVSKIYLPQEFVCLKGERGFEMFFILRGRFEVIMPESTTRVFLKDGDFFGERCLMENSRRPYSIQSITHSELLVLQKSDFKLLLKLFPDFAASMQKYAAGETRLFGWKKIAHVIKTVKMVRLLGGNTTFETMFLKMHTERNNEKGTIEGIKKIVNITMANKQKNEDVRMSVGKRLLENRKLKRQANMAMAATTATPKKSTTARGGGGGGVAGSGGSGEAGAPLTASK